jgi:drug/metabolite transporter (DMT)-like permease
MSTSNNNPKGILLILIGMALFSIQDSLIKYVFEDLSLYELYFGRTFVATVWLFSFLLISKKKIVFKTHYPLLTLLRVILFFIGFSSFYISLSFMTLAMANALFFSSPFFMSIFAKIFLKEDIGVRRWSAIVVGFLGVVVVLNPDFSNFNYFNLLPVLCAFCYAASMTITKITSDKDGVYTQMIHLYMAAITFSLIIYYFAGKGQFNNFDNPTLQFILRDWFSNPTHSWPYIFIMGTVAAISFYCVFSAYSIASPSVVSLFEYSLIIWAMIAGYILFKTIPETNTFIGSAIIIAAGVYIYMREKARDQMIVTDTPNR